jgi:hypothetical protein
MDNMDKFDNIDKNETKNTGVDGNGGKIREDKINNLDKNIQQSEIEYDELFDLMAKRRQLLEKK